MNLSDFTKKVEKHDEKSVEKPHSDYNEKGLRIETEEEIKNWKKI